jgi:hypothetical protein
MLTIPSLLLNGGGLWSWVRRRRAWMRKLRRLGHADCEKQADEARKISEIEEDDDDEEERCVNE